MAACERTAYICWALGGILGLHHFYLGRDVQAFVWFITLGGGIIGWLRDFRKIPKYVNEANGETRDGKLENVFDAVIWGALGIAKRKPSASWTLMIGQILLGVLFSTLFHFAIPVWLVSKLNVLFRWVLLVGAPVLGSALGVYLASNISPYKLSFRHCFNENTLWWTASGIIARGGIVAFAPLFVVYRANKELDKASPNVIKKTQNTFKILTKRCFVASLLCFLYLALVYHVVCYNDPFMTSDGRFVKLHEVTSGYWAYYRRNGLRQVGDDAVKYMDPRGKYRAYWTLGFRSPWMSIAELKSHCRKMSAQWHPDRFSSSEKDYADTKYKDIVNACDILKKLN